IKSTLPEGSNIGELLSSFGLDVVDDIYEIGKKIHDKRAEYIKLYGSPENENQVLVYDSNGNPSAWYNKDVAESIVGHMWSQGWRIGSENASEYMNLTPPSGDSNGGNG